MRFAGFDWDAGNHDKVQTHGVSIAEIEGLFIGVVNLSPDPAHSAQEERIKAFGVTAEGRHLLVVFTVRKRETGLLIRPISARYMHAKEVTWYEKETSGSDD